MPKINEVITSRNYELVLYQIASILTDEIANQRNLSNSTERVSIAVNKMNASNSDEEVLINIYLGKVNNYSKDIWGSRQGVFYYIDVTASTISIEGEYHYTTSGRLRDKYVGYIHYILNNGLYKDLDLQGVVTSAKVEEIKNQDYTYDGDSYATMVSRIIVNVDLVESQNLDEGVAIEDTFTDTTINGTRGFKKCN